MMPNMGGDYIRTRAATIHALESGCPTVARPIDSIAASHDSRRIDGFILAGT